MIGVITACFNWSGKHAFLNDLFTMDCTTGKIILKNILNKPTGTGSNKQFFYLFMFEIAYDTSLVNKREELVKECTVKEHCLRNSFFHLVQMIKLCGFFN